MMKELRKNGGITLIALVITIIVLLILVGIGIGALQESGIVGNAKSAIVEYQNGEEYENNIITDMEAIIEETIIEQKIPKLSAEEKKELENLLVKYGDNKYANYGNPTEEQLALANKTKAELLKNGINLDEALNIRKQDGWEYIWYFHDKKVVINEDTNELREVAVDEFVVFERIFEIAKCLDEKLKKGEYTIKGSCYYIEYNGRTYEFISMAGSYECQYNENYVIYASGNLAEQGCLGF